VTCITRFLERCGAKHVQMDEKRELRYSVLLLGVLKEGCVRVSMSCVT
jgi:hypothetical protein